MSAEFSAKLSMLRKEKDVSQKQAAADLGVSQALLSHYEKGIRECSLDFVKKSAAYYGVSADYLLGLSAQKQGSNDLTFFDALETDRILQPKTVLRAMIRLSEAARDPDAEAFFDAFFSLCVEKYALTLGGDVGNALPLNALAADLLVRERLRDRPAPVNAEGEAALETVLEAAKLERNEKLSRLMRGG